jgi:hypothetical protein
VLLKNNVIKLKAGHTIPTTEQLAQKKYCKWGTRFGAVVVLQHW